MCWNWWRTCELCIWVHSSHCVCHTIACRTCCHIVWVKCSSCATTWCNREVCFAFFVAEFFVGSCNRVLESGWVGWVTSDWYINIFMFHDCNAFVYIVSAVASNFASVTIRESPCFHNVEFCVQIIIFGSNISETVYTRNDVCSVFSKTVQDNLKWLFSNFVSG